MYEWNSFINWIGAFTWLGLFPTIASKIGGKPVNQIIGTTFGTFIFALIYSLVQGIALPSGAALIWSIISGIGWASAQILTFHSFTWLSQDRVLPWAVGWFVLCSFT